MALKKSNRLLGFLLLSLICLSGCETAKGAASGVGSIAEGAQKDGVKLWQGILQADNWIKKNLW